MLIEEFNRIDPGKEPTKISVILSNVCCISPAYDAVKNAAPNAKKLNEKNCVIAMANGMVIMVDTPYKSLLQKLKAYHPR